MVLHPRLRGAIGGLAAVLLVWLAWEGISGGITQWSDTVTPWQRIQYVTQLGYGVFAILALITAFRWQQFRRFVDVGFVISASAAAGIASVVWGGTSMLAGVASGIAAAIIAALIVWMLNVGIRNQKPELKSGI